MQDDVTLAPDAPVADHHRRSAAHLYGLIVTGAVLATASDDFRLSRVAINADLSMVAIYWSAETYVHWSATRVHLQRDLTPGERLMIVRDGWPLVAACAVPLVALGLEALLGLETAVALDITLALNAVLLFLTYSVGRWAGTVASPEEAAFSAIAAGFLGVSLIVLKSLLH